MRRLIIGIIGIYLFFGNSCKNITEDNQKIAPTDFKSQNLDSVLAYGKMLVDSLDSLSAKNPTYFEIIQAIKQEEQLLKLNAVGRDILAKVGYFENNYFAYANKYDKVVDACQYYNLYASKKLDSTYKCIIAVALGNAYERLGDTKKAVATLEAGLLFAYSLRSAPQIAQAAVALANSYGQQQEFEKAKDVVFKASAFTTKLQSADKELLQIMKINIMEDSELQILEIQKMLQTAKESHSLFYLHTFMGNLLENSNAKDALAHYMQAANTPNQEKRTIAKTYLSISNIYYNNLKKDSANFYIDKALQLIIPTKNNGGKLLPIYDSLTTENTIYDLCVSKSDMIIEDTNKSVLDIEYAVDNLLAAKRVAELIRKELVFDESKYNWGIDLKQVSDRLVQCYYKLFNITKQSKYAERAFMIIEEAKATAMQDNTEQNILAAESTDTNYARYITLQRQLNDTEIRIVSARNEVEQENLKISRLAIIKQLGMYKSLMHTALNKIETSYSYAQLQEYLKRHKWNAINYFIGSSHVYALYLNAANGNLKFIQCDTSIIDSVQALCNMQLLANAYQTENNRYVRLSNSIYNILVGNIMDNSTNKNLLVLPDGVFNNLAFDALITDKNKGNAFLILEQKLSFAYSIRSLIMQQERAFCASDKIQAIAPFSDASIRNLPFLPSCKSEVQEIANHFNGAAELDSSATYNSFQEQLKDSKYMHIASHAIGGEKPKLEFYDSSVFINSIYQIPMCQSLAYLNTCQSGNGVNYYSEGNLSLGRAFYANGVHNVILTFWNMHDASTAAISKLFYASLKKKQNSIDALYEAKLAYLQSQPKDKQAPYYWASLQHIGDGQLAEPNKFRVWRNWLIGLLSIIAMVFIMHKSRKTIN
jgi:CHAT domain-containing protein